MSGGNDAAIDAFIGGNRFKIFNEVNFSISLTEIDSALRRVKTGKASGPDMILNEMLKAGKPVLFPVLHKLFNRILTESHFPQQWRRNFLSPLHKKGDPLLTCNYKGIAIGSAMGKLFCSILNQRLTTFSEEHDLIPRCQIGFRHKIGRAHV